MNQILSLSLALSLSLLFSLCPHAKAQKEIGIQLYSVKNHMKADPTETVKQVGAMGYDFVEAAGYANGQFYGLSPEAFKSLVESSGMKFLSSHTSHPLPDATNYEAAMAWWDQCIEAHRRAGVKYIVQPSMNKDAYQSLETLKRYCDYFNAIGEKCNKKGILFGYHNHAKEFGSIEGTTIYDFMLKHTDPAKVFFQLDLYWIHEGKGDALAYFKNYPGRFKLWHVKDEKELAIDGKMDFSLYFSQAKTAGMEHFIVEVERYNFEPMISIQKSLYYLRHADFLK